MSKSEPARAVDLDQPAADPLTAPPIPMVVVSANTSWNILNFRMGLINALRNKGYRVIVIAPEDEYSAALIRQGIDFRALAMDRSGLSPIADFMLFTRYFRMLRALRPDALLSFTIKPNIYGSLAARLLGIKVVNNISGLGTAFIRGGLLAALVQRLYRIALKRSATVFFQNGDDLALFTNNKLVRTGQARLLPGSGIDLDHFTAAQTSDGHDRPFRFLMIARLLWDKGIQEYVDAARIVRASDAAVRFQLLGPIDRGNRTAVPREQIDQWSGEGLIDYLGTSDDVRPSIGQADCIVLPSYREGLPRSLLEGSAMAKPLIATRVPGVRDVVADGETGLLCEVRNARSLADAMIIMCRLPADARKSMGLAGRRKIESEFSQELVIERYLTALA